MATKRANAAISRQSAERRPPQPLLDEVDWRLRLGKQPDAIAYDLRSMAAEGDIAAPPTGRTIRNWIAKGWVRRLARPTDPWSLMRGRAEDVALVMPVLPLIARLSRESRWLSIEEAEALARVRRAAPGIPHAVALTLAVAYTRRGNEETADLDLFLSMAPWQGADEPAEQVIERRRKYRAIAQAAGLDAITASAQHPGQAYSLIDGSPLGDKPSARQEG